MRVPALAVAALRGHVERFLCAHGVVPGQLREDAELDSLDLVNMLLAALRHVRAAHPWLGRDGAVVEPPEPDPPGLLLAVHRALPAFDAPLTVDACIDALRRASPFVIDDGPCGRRSAPPGVYPYLSLETDEALTRDDLADRVFAVVADEGWHTEPDRWDAVLTAVVPANAEPTGFEALAPEPARTLAGHLLAGRPAAAAAFVTLFGRDTRCFGLRDQGSAADDPFAHGHAWSCYDADGYGSWGRTLVLAATDGLRVAYLDALWDVASE
ncbi:hypothetical protein [Nannocystis radixulma]|uniref:Carrier domain-containing protein n=1 Tax=Nannocystis radixulma TaxID=2995305 RepID=A0ABT5B7B2_9BACT|nr:hypothetical protein [Nannocystis radixulma]MDC0669353.1 hypothetical protein [Nannocystis radixulma]